MDWLQIAGYCLICGVMIAWAGSRQSIWTCAFVAIVGGVTTVLVAAGACQLLALPFSDWYGPVGALSSIAVYSAYMTYAWRECGEVVTVGGIGYRLAASVRRTAVGVSRRRSAMADVKRVARGEPALRYRIEVE